MKIYSYLLELCCSRSDKRCSK